MQKSKVQFLSLLLVFCLCIQGIAFSQKVMRPKLVVGIVVDQMRWDFLYRYQDRYSTSGFKRLLSQGFTCENAHIPYAPTVTAAGHACVYSGSVPAINGVVGNDWYEDGKMRYCASDTTVNAVGAKKKTNGQMSPRNLWTSTLSDELRIATNFRGKAVGVCIKDRGAIFPAGHSANAAFWFESASGRWITSDYYTQSLPTWLEEYNNSGFIKNYFSQNWQLLYPKASYQSSTTDEKIYEGKFKNNPSSSLPYTLDTLYHSPSIIATTPYGNSMTLEVAKLALQNYGLGQDDDTDMLCISFSSTDYIGHQFGPNSIEIEDTYLRLDLEIGNFLNYLDAKIGKENYTLFLTADHGVAHVPAFLQENKIPGKIAQSSKLIIDLNDVLFKKYGVADLIKTEANYQLYLDENKINKKKKSFIKEVTKSIIHELQKDEAVLYAFYTSELNNQIMPDDVKEKFKNGYHQKRSGDIQIVLRPGYVDVGLTGTTHGSPFPYDTHIPIIFYGQGIKQGKSYRPYDITDIAPTLAALLKIQMPNGCVGHVIDECINDRN